MLSTCLQTLQFEIWESLSLGSVRDLPRDGPLVVLVLPQKCNTMTTKGPSPGKPLTVEEQLRVCVL